MLIVKKFGGTSVGDKQRMYNVANRCIEEYKKGNDVVVVLSAMGKYTDELIRMAHDMDDKPPKREMDMLMAAGEQISIALLAMAIDELGCPAISLLGWQAGFRTDSVYSAARIKKVETDRIRTELDNRKIVVVAGFQGLNKYQDMTTLGRGGSDTSAVAIAAALNADRCQIFTDVDGVYTADPRKVAGARRLQEITYDEMLELATLGAQVLNNRSVEMAKKYNVELEVISSLNPIPGTIVKETTKMEKMLVRGVTKDKDVSKISIVGVEDVPGIAFKVFSQLAKNNINVDIILQSVGRDNTKDIVFTVSMANEEEAVECIKALPFIGDAKVFSDNTVAKVSVVGAGMETHPGTASKMFEALYGKGINIQTISTSEIKISVLIDEKDADKAVSAVHEAFFGND